MPVSAGGLGIRRAVLLALPAFLALAASTHSLQSLMLLSSLSAHNRQQPRKAYENLDHHLQHEHTGLTK